MLETVPVQQAQSPNESLSQSAHVQDGDQDYNETTLIASPYTTPSHLLSLPTLDQASQLLAKCLTLLQPIREDYATAPYIDSFNWPAVFTLLQDLCKREAYTWNTNCEFFVVVFRSRLLPDADTTRLFELDERSHEEANLSGGLLKYWFGRMNCKRENLATCVWRGRTDARRGGLGAWHCEARGAAKDTYEWVGFGMLRLEVGDGGRIWRFSEWVE